MANWPFCVPQGFNYRNSTFCPRIVFVCFVWISEQPLFRYTALSDLILGAFTKLRKTTVRSVPSARQSVCLEQFGSNRIDFHEI